MPEFAWRAAQADGQLLEGRFEAAAADAVLRHLRERGLTPIKVEDAAAADVAVPGRGNRRALRGPRPQREPRASPPTCCTTASGCVH